MDQEVERLLSGLSLRQFTSRDEQEVAGYAERLRLRPLQLLGEHH